jgi:type II secretory pathway pseudopilin PulG
MRNAGFTIVELLIATAMTMAVVGAILAVINPAQLMFRAQGDAADLHQRLRAAADTMAADVRAAMAVRPYRVGATRDDAAVGVYYRPDTLTVLEVPSSPLSLDANASRTYYLRSAGTPNTFQLMQYDGGLSDLPMLDHVVRLSFDYFGTATASGPLVRLDPATLVDGPWIQDAAQRTFDADLLRVREVRALLRLESTDPMLRPLVPDEEIILHIAMRNTSGGH